MNQKERSIVYILAAMQFTHILDFVIIMPLGPQLMRKLDIGTAEFSLLVSSYTISGGIAGLITAMFIDRYDRKFALLFFYTGFLAGTALCALSFNFAQLLMARIIAGAFGGVLGAIIYAAVGDLIREDIRGTATGIIMSAFSVSSVIGIPAGVHLAALSSFRIPFLAIFLLGLIVYFFALRILPVMTGHFEIEVSDRLKRFLYIASVRNHQNSFLLITVLMMAGFSVIPYIAPYLVSNGGLAESDLAYVYLVGGICTFFTARWIGRLSDRIGKYQTFVSIAAISTIPIVMMTNISEVSLLKAMFMVAFLMIFVSGRLVPAFAMITGSVKHQYRGSFMSMHGAVQHLAAGIAALTAGFILDYRGETILNYEKVGIMAVGFTILAIFVAKLIRPVS